MSTLSERISALLEARAVTQLALSRVAGVTAPSVAAWLSGKTKNIKAIPAMRLAAYYGLSFHWLTQGKGAMDNTGEIDLVDLDEHPDLAPVRRVKITFSAGITGVAINTDEEDGTPIFFRRDWLKDRGFKQNCLIAVRVNGNSMQPGLWDGDIAVINMDDKHIKDGEVYSVNYEGEPVIKRLKRNAGEWWLHSDNPDQTRFSPKLATEGVDIIGRVVYKQSEVL